MKLVKLFHNQSLSLSLLPSPARGEKKRKRGFTIIELIMTIIVVTVTAIPLSQVVFQHIEGAFDSEKFTIARNLARSEMERVNNLLYANIVNANFPNYDGYNYDITRTVSYAAGRASSAESLKKIVIAVNKSGDPQVLESLVTFIAKNVGYGI